MHRMMVPDPRRKTGPFESLFKKIQACKSMNVCPTLRTKQFFYEPNGYTAPSWKEKGVFREGIDHRVMFVCESPGPSASEGNPATPERCWSITPRDRRFQEAREKYGLGSCYITNTVKCGVRRGSQHAPSEVEACRGFLIREINLIAPQIIVAVGNNAERTLREHVLPHLLTHPPRLFRITHYSCRRNVWKSWDKEFPELVTLLDRFRPRDVPK